MCVAICQAHKLSNDEHGMRMDYLIKKLIFVKIAMVEIFTRFQVALGAAMLALTQECKTQLHLSRFLSLYEGMVLE